MSKKTDVKITRSTPEALQKLKDSKAPEEEILAKRGKMKGLYNHYIKQIEKSDQPAEKLRLYRMAKESLIDNMQSYKIDKEWAEKKLQRVDTAIDRIGDEIGFKASDFIVMDYTEFKDQFSELLPTMEAYLKDQGMILPKSAWELSDMFIEKAFSSGEYGKIKATLSRKDFIEFHKMIEARLNEIEPKRKEPAPNEFRKEREKLAKENEPKRKQFISDAKTFLHEKISAGKSRSNYITDRGWPTVKFYRDPFRSSDIPEATRKDWIKKAISKSEI